MITLEFPNNEDEDGNEWELYEDFPPDVENTDFSHVISEENAQRVLLPRDQQQRPNLVEGRATSRPNLNSFMLDAHTFADFIPPLSFPGVHDSRRFLTMSPLGFNFHSLGILADLEYRTWDSLLALIEFVKINPLVIEQEVQDKFTLQRAEVLLQQFWYFVHDLWASMVHYLRAEFLAFQDAVEEQQLKYSIRNAESPNVEAQEGENQDPPPALNPPSQRQKSLRKLTSRQADQGKHVIKSLPSLEFINRFKACRVHFNAQHLNLCLVRSEKMYNSARVIEFSVALSTGLANPMMLRIFYDASDAVSRFELLEEHEVMELLTPHPLIQLSHYRHEEGHHQEQNPTELDQPAYEE